MLTKLYHQGPVMNMHKKVMNMHVTVPNTDGLVQDCSNSIANAMELLQSCTKPSIYA